MNPANLDYDKMAAEFVVEAIEAIKRQAKEANLEPQNVQVIFSLQLVQMKHMGVEQPTIMTVFKIMKNKDFKNATEITGKKLLNIKFIDIKKKADFLSAFVALKLHDYMIEFSVEYDKIFVFVEFGKTPENVEGIKLSLYKLDEGNVFRFLKIIQPQEIFNESVLMKALGMQEEVEKQLNTTGE